MSRPVQLQTLIQEFLKHCKTHLRPATMRSYRASLERFSRSVGPKPAREVTTSDIDTLIARERNRGRAPGSINVLLRCIKACLRWGARPDIGLIPPHTVSIRLLRVPDVRKGRAFGPEDIQRLIQLARPREKALIALIAATALRIDEALHLRWGDIDFEALTVEVCAKPDVNWEPKNHQARTVFFSVGVKRHLEAYRETQSKFWNGPECWVFHGKRPGIRLKTCAKPARDLFEAAGLYSPGKLWHELRRGCATAMLRSGVDIDTVRVILGHESITTTQRYLRTGDEQKQAASRHALL